MIRISAPFVSRVVAKLCRSVCACIFFRMPALIPYCLTMFVIKNRVRRTDVSVRWSACILSTSKLCRINRGLNVSWRMLRYSAIAVVASSVRYTTRIFHHLPRTANSRVLRLTSFLSSAVSSDIRSPVE
jgi:hypothetical protein